MYYDIEKIKEHLKPIDIITELQVLYKRKGNNLFILCPGPTHEIETGSPDEHIGNCILGDTFRNAYYCFGCGARGNAFTLIAHLLGLDLEKNFNEILSVAADICGGSHLYEMNSNSQNKVSHKRKEKNINLLTKSQLDIIGLGNSSYPTIYTECFSGKFDSNGALENLTKDLNYKNLDPLGFPEVSYLESKGLNYSLTNLLNEDFETYAWLVSNKSKEAMLRYKKLALNDWNKLAASIGIKTDALTSFSEELKNLCKAKYLEAEAIWKLYADQDELDQIDDSWVFGYDMITERKPGAIL